MKHSSMDSIGLIYTHIFVLQGIIAKTTLRALKWIPLIPIQSK